MARGWTHTQTNTYTDFLDKCNFKQVDVLPSKNQAKINHCQSTAIQCIVIVLNDVSSKSCEQGLITKEHIAMHTNLILLFKPALYSCTLVETY